MYVTDNRQQALALLEQNQTPIYRKLVLQGSGGGPKVYLDHQVLPFSALGPDDCLDTVDVCHIFGCSTRTVYRWVAQNSLIPEGKIGRELLFTKRELLRWYGENAPRMGRPPMQGRWSE